MSDNWLDRFSADGHVIWVALSVSLVRDARGAARCFIAQILDITARKAADEALLTSERHLADAQALGARWNERRHRLGDQRVVCHHLGVAQELGGPHREQRRIAGTCAHQVDRADHDSLRARR